MKQHRLSLLLYFIVILEGATGLFIELVSAQMMAPLYGTSLSVWASVIGVSIASLTIGYYVGGYWAYRVRVAHIFYITLAISLHLLLLPLYSESFIFAISAFPLIGAVLLASIVILVFPLLLLGTLPPFIVQILTERVPEAGEVAGKLFTLSTIGGIAGALITGFWLLPAFGFRYTLMGASTLLGGVAVFYLLARKKLLFSLYLVVLLFGWVIVDKTVASFSASRVDVKYLSEGLLGQVMVADIPENTSSAQPDYHRLLFVNRMGQTWINLSTGQSQWEYVDYAVQIARTLPARSEVLILGLGGGHLANRMHQELGFGVDAVELDPRITHVARQYFALDTAVNVTTDDARHHLRTLDQKYNLMFFDIFKGEMPPSHVLTVECFRDLKRKLADKGLLVINFNGFLEGAAGLPGRSLLKTLKKAGFSVKLLPTPGPVWNRNVLFIAARHPVELPQQTNVGLSQKFYDQSQLSLENAYLLTDNRPLLEKINYKAARAWRDNYTANFTKELHERGIPLYR
jgi:predicted membrane-bound spermidine synthase